MLHLGALSDGGIPLPAAAVTVRIIKLTRSGAKLIESAGVLGTTPVPSVSTAPGDYAITLTPVQFPVIAGQAYAADFRATYTPDGETDPVVYAERRHLIGALQ